MPPHGLHFFVWPVNMLNVCMSPTLCSCDVAVNVNVNSLFGVEFIDYNQTDNANYLLLQQQSIFRLN